MHESVVRVRQHLIHKTILLIHLVELLLLLAAQFLCLLYGLAVALFQFKSTILESFSQLARLLGVFLIRGILKNLLLK